MFAALVLAPLSFDAQLAWEGESRLGWAADDSRLPGAAGVQLYYRLFAAAAAVLLGGWAAFPILFCRGKRAARSFVWASDGSWHLQRLDGSWDTAHLLPATATLGPGASWAVLLVWAIEGSGPAWRRRRYALIDVSQVGIPAFRALLGRLKLGAGSAARPVSP